MHPILFKEQLAHFSLIEKQNPFHMEKLIPRDQDLVRTSICLRPFLIINGLVSSGNGREN